MTPLPVMGQIDTDCLRIQRQMNADGLPFVLEVVFLPTGERAIHCAHYDFGYLQGNELSFLVAYFCGQHYWPVGNQTFIPDEEITLSNHLSKMAS